MKTVTSERCNTHTLHHSHCMKNVHIRSYSGPHFSAFGLHTERYSVSLRIQVRMRENADQNNSEYGHLLRSASKRYYSKNNNNVYML